MRIMNPRITATEITAVKNPVIKSALLPSYDGWSRSRRARASQLRHLRASRLTPPGVGFEHLCYRFQLCSIRLTNDGLDDLRDLIETDRTIQESGHRNFIRGVQRHRLRAARLRCHIA